MVAPRVKAARNPVRVGEPTPRFVRCRRTEAPQSVATAAVASLEPSSTTIEMTAMPSIWRGIRKRTWQITAASSLAGTITAMVLELVIAFNGSLLSCQFMDNVDQLLSDSSPVVLLLNCRGGILAQLPTPFRIFHQFQEALNNFVQRCIQHTILFAREKRFGSRQACSH